MKKILRSIWNAFAHLWGRLSGKYYCEDFIRVYPDNMVFNRFGRKRQATADEIRNYQNHQKFYHFAAQFVPGAKVADIGCGSGHGCAILSESGAAGVWGADVSRHSLDFARKRFGSIARFSEQGITSLKDFEDDFFDVTISSEVLEHILEYGKEDEAVAELKRVTRSGGIVIIGTPNSELAPDHGFPFEVIDLLMQRHFPRYCIFENALIPFGKSRTSWDERLTKGKTGVIVTQKINFEETLLPAEVIPEIKRGLEPGPYRLGDLEIDTRLLHNTHSWAVVAVKD